MLIATNRIEIPSGPMIRHHPPGSAASANANSPYQNRISPR